LGYQGDGYDTCDDINECDQGFSCGTNEECLNLPGTATCTCAGGYEDLGAGCVDINECVPGGVGELFCTFFSETCDNSDGGFSCVPAGPQCNGFCEGPGDCPEDCFMPMCPPFCPGTCGNGNCDGPSDFNGGCPEECDP
jgi:hypothetical protein